MTGRRQRPAKKTHTAGDSEGAAEGVAEERADEQASEDKAAEQADGYAHLTTHTTHAMTMCGWEMSHTSEMAVSHHVS